METTPTAFSNQEADFKINELFFSITKHDSTIVSGNEVFVRISGYTKAELIGEYHNIIRHSDMPKAVFKLFWDYLKAGKSVVAYVKNKTKEGKFYWVLAAVFPLKDRYVSLRIKPSSPLFAVARELYFKVLMCEGREGVEAAESLLLSSLNDLGYPSYDAFMSDALLQELRSRQNLISQSSSENEVFVVETQLDEMLERAYDYASGLKKTYAQWFEKISLFSEINTMLGEKGQLLRELARDMIFLSLNASVSSYKVANGGETFGVLAQDIRLNVKENDALVDELHTISSQLTESLNSIIFSASAIHLQIEMICYFIEEILYRRSNDTTDTGENIDLLAILVDEYVCKIDGAHKQLALQITEATKYLDRIERQVMYLGYVQIYGIIEAAGSLDQNVNFEGIFTQLKALIQKTSQEVETIQKRMNHFFGENQILLQKSSEITPVLKTFKGEIIEITDLERCS